MKQLNDFKIVLIGGKGITQVYITILKKMGFTNLFLLSSSPLSSIRNSSRYLMSHGLKVTAITRKQYFLEKIKPDAIIICSSDKSHLEYLLYGTKHNIPIFCEKPLFWFKNINYDTIFKSLLKIFAKRSNKLFLNTSNRYFIDCIKKNTLLDIKKIKCFKFTFHTNGKNEFDDIGVDLLPHGLSILYNLFGYKKIEKIKKKISKNNFNCFFEFGGYKVEFDFSEGKFIQKEMVLKINNNEFKRIQKGFGKNYNLLIHDLNDNKLFKMEDPFSQHLSKFFSCIKSSNFKKSNDLIHAKNSILQSYQILNT